MRGLSGSRAIGAAVLLVIIVLVSWSIGASSQTDQDENELRDKMFLGLGIHGYQWQNENGKPADFPEDRWVAVTPELGFIWEPVQDAPDLVLWMVLRDGMWRETQTVKRGPASPYREL